MRRKLFVLILVGVLGFNFSAHSDEGMWLPFLIGKKNYDEMQKLGIKLTPQQLYDVNNASLKDAIVMLDGGSCTGEMISSKGLLLTNHHCAYDNIQSHSTVEDDYLTDGFWAMNLEEELPNPGKTASFLVKIEDVTDKVLADVSDTMKETNRFRAIRAKINEITNTATEGTHYNAMVQDMFRGNHYYLFVYETFQDVRLVGAPPSSIGNYGDDIDNWMWPRHTGDFSLYRVYAGPDGKPAPYSKDNVPYQPKHHLPVSIKGIEKGDFAMIWGYPGTTDRYLPSYGLKLKLDIISPNQIDIEGKKLEILKDGMDKDDKTRIQYASKQALVANVWKKTIEEAKALKRLKVYEKKKALEDKFNAWANKDKKRASKYGTVVKDMEDAYKEIEKSKVNLARWYMIELLYLVGPESFGIAQEAGDLKKQLEDKKDTKELIEVMKQHAEGYFKDYNTIVDKNLFAAVLKMYKERVPEEFHPDIFTVISDKYDNDFEKFAEAAFEKSPFVSKDKYLSFLEKPKAKTIEEDLVYKTAVSVQTTFFNVVMANYQTVAVKLNKARRLFIAGLMEMDPERNFYPDANSTMRVTYGTVKDYYPRDAVHYDWITYMSGIMEKEDPTMEEFKVPEKLKEIYKKKDFGPYGVGDKMPVNFLTDNDITGGNSGSPVINANGELIGAAFDGNSEAMSGDIEFDPPLQRTIVADIRYILLVIDKYAGAKHLVDEMTIVK